MTSYTKWTEASPDENLAAVAVRSLDARLQAVQEYLEKAALQADKEIEHVHQMRVWSRRADAALQLYQALMPDWRVQRIAKHLNRIRRAGNDARDDDVFAARLAEEKDSPAAKLLLKRVQAHRRQAQEPIVAIYQKLGPNGRLAKRAKKLLDRVGTGRRAKLGKVCFGDWAACRLRAETGEFFQAAAADLSDVEHLHQLRIAGKQLRYTIELLAAGVPDAIRGTVYPMIKDLQDRLGAINDHATAHQRLDRWLGEAPSEMEREFLENHRDAERMGTATLREEFLQWWNGSREADLRQAFAECLGSCHTEN
jgi:CHAD domain-containing protein